MALRKVCVANGCDDLALAGLSHCGEHEAARLARLAERRAKAKTSDAAVIGVALYGAKKWRDASRAWLARFPLCCDCGELGVVEAATDVDHKEPHRGDLKKFWDRRNWQSLCKRCHSRKTAREVFHGAGR